jgi:four helix bundle protein
MITSLENFNVYNKAMALGSEVWTLTQPWDKFAKYTVGIQLVKSVDSIAANLSEGLGRYSVKEVRQFGIFSRGSLFETKTWLQKAKQRQLIVPATANELIVELDVTGKMLNAYLNSLGKGL